MEERTYEVGSAVAVQVTARKNLTLQGDAVSHVQLSGEGAATASWIQQEDHYVLEAHRNIEVVLPQNAQVRLIHVGGHCEARDLGAGIAGEAIGGHAKFQRTGALTLDKIGGHMHVTACQGHVQSRQVGGHLHLDQCSGDVRIGHVGGHAKAYHIGGTCHLPTVGGHAHLEDVQQELQVNAGGHVRASIHPQGVQVYDIRAGGRLACTMPRNTHATIEMRSSTLGTGTETRVWGEGTAQVHLHAGAHIALQDEDLAQPGPDPARVGAEEIREGQWVAEGVTQQIRDGVNQVLGQVTDKINRALQDHGLDSQQRADLQAQFKDIRRDAMETAREAAVNVQVQSRDIWEKEVKPSLVSPRKSDAKAAPDPQALAEERKMILQMLAENKITVDEANELLKTLSP